MDIGIAYDLKSDFLPSQSSSAPDDLLEEYDSLATVEAIAGALAERGHRPRLLGGGERFLRAVLAAPPELVFNIAEGRGGRSREAHVPAVCEMLAIPCTHSDALTMAVTLEKAMAKRIVASLGVATAPFAVVEDPEGLARVALEYPLFVKPLAEGSSMGIRAGARVRTAAELEPRVRSLLEAYAEPVLVEEYLPGAEFTVAVHGNVGGGLRAIVAEIEPKRAARADFVYSLEVKRAKDWSELFDYHVPPRREAAEIEAVERVALAAYRALGCRDIARVDVRVDRRGEPCFIECNPLPGIAPGWSDLAQIWQRAGLSYGEGIGSILEAALGRLRLGGGRA